MVREGSWPASSSVTLAWFVFRVLTFRETGSFFETLGKDFFGLFYLPLFMPFFILIRNQAEGILWIFFLLAVNYAGDTAAYYVGRTWGRHKLAPRVSPQKTIEGSLGGLIANGLTALIFQQTGLARCGAGEIMLVGGVIGVSSQFGDLTESLLKRAAGSKDSGSLFPGHGGFLDRVDSLLFPAPWLYYYLQWRGPMG